jgi:DNA modification methylase
VSDAAFYSYTAPEPQGYSIYPVRPAGAFYHPEMKEFVLMYEDVRNASSPANALLDFFQSTYEAGATLGKWDRASLERTEGVKEA